MKQARIQLTADTRGFKKQIDDAKAMIKTLGESNIKGGTGEKLRQIYGVQLGRSLKELDKQIKNTEKTLATMADASSKTFDGAKIVTFTSKLDQLKKKYAEIKTLQDQMANGKLPDVSEAGGKSRGFLGGAGRFLTGLAGGMGVMSLFSRREQMADQRLRIRSLTTNGQGINETSALGFSPEERRQRAAELAGATPVSGTELTSLTNMGEQMERAYGIQGGEFAGAVGAARKAGMGNQGKFVTDAIKSATGAGLQGPQIGEYLQSMTGYLSEMSKGVNIDGESLNGFASAMSTLPFFKNDPARTFDMIRSMNSAFVGGDEFQKAQAIRAIGMSNPAASASSMEFRREMGLFGKLGNKDLENLKKAGVDTKTLGIGGGELVNNIFKDIMSNTAGQNPNDQLYQFMKRTGMEPGAAASIFGQLKTGGMDMTELEKQVREAGKSPEERLNDTFQNADGSIKQLTAMLARVADGMATNIAEPMTRLAHKIDELIKALGGDTEDVMTTAGTAAVGVAAGVGAYGAVKTAGGLLKNGGKAAGKAIPKSMGKGLKGMSKAIPKGLKAGTKATGKALGRALPFVGLGLFAKDAYDVYEKWQNGEEITPKDWAVLTTSGLAGAAGMVPGIGTAASLAISGASAGAEFLPDDFMQSGSSSAAGQIPAGGVPNSTNGGVPQASGMIPGSGAGSENDFALLDNTNAIRDLTGALRMGPQKSGIQDRFPSGAKFADGVRTGK